MVAKRMMRFAYALVAAVLCVGVGMFAVQSGGQRGGGLPVVAQPDGFAELSCSAGVDRARSLVRSGAVDAAAQAYLWLAVGCADDRMLPDILLEAGSLFGHMLRNPAWARASYERLLDCCSGADGADTATYQLARLEIDDGDFAAAVSHLTILAERYPTTPHIESARVLSLRAAEMLTARRQESRTVSGQVRELVPNNAWSVLAVIAAVGPAMMEAFRRARDATGVSRLAPTAILALTILNYFINNAESARRDADILAKLEGLKSVAARQ